MNNWEITLSDKKIRVYGNSLEDAVRRFGNNHPRMKIECGLLVRVKKKGIYSYWSAERFLELLG